MTEITPDREFEYFYCPVTGEPVLHPDGYTTSPALLFIYVEEIKDFEYCSEQLREKFAAYFDENAKKTEGELLFKKLKEELPWGQDKLLITYGNVGAASLCFDLGYEKR
ncbi:hypothetical protein RM549_03005 [Salegentibacter sp. F188]|uniref:Uncharacterized protein n=1 Tax=Autumnicola patrickiae TaxID=3075591 RepID=A0ABU3DYD5_9FLAO|nr:hypothetical protein [Salegentibacter sp. F188]MDT0688734.1 hypothetical protein [Salegentibacter sp. F188]